jgi:hypothetical protein
MNDDSNIVKFPRRPNRVGQISIWPCEIDGGSWGIYLDPTDPFVPPRCVGSHIDFDNAVAMARAYAAKTGAELVGVDAEGGAA